jgi:hypothetical protein
MQGKILYEYAVIRIVPCIEREEFLNVGVITFSKRPRFLKVIYHINEERLKMFGKEIDIEGLKQNLKAFEEICNGTKAGGTIAQWEVDERFRWLTAVKSSILQTSRPHNGFSDDMEKTTECLFKKLVL